jgi:hypothetical protein
MKSSFGKTQRLIGIMNFKRNLAIATGNYFPYT